MHRLSEIDDQRRNGSPEEIYTDSDCHTHDTEEFMSVDKMAIEQHLINCYQMQPDDNNNCVPVYLGKYPDIPLPVNKIFNFNNYLFVVVTYVLTEDEIEKGLYKIVGVNIFDENNKNSLYSIDLIKKNDIYQIIFNNNDKGTTDVIENLKGFPDRDHILEYVIKKSFEESIISKLSK